MLPSDKERWGKAEAMDLWPSWSIMIWSGLRAFRIGGGSFPFHVGFMSAPPSLNGTLDAHSVFANKKNGIVRIFETVENYLRYRAEFKMKTYV